MVYNAFIVDWTMADLAEPQHQLTALGLQWALAGEGGHLRVAVPYERRQAFAALCQERLNAPCNYVDLQYPQQGQTVLFFRERVCTISSEEENRGARAAGQRSPIPPNHAHLITILGVSYRQATRRKEALHIALATPSDAG